MPQSKWNKSEIKTHSIMTIKNPISLAEYIPTIYVLLGK